MPTKTDTPDRDLYLPEAVRSRHRLDDLPEQFVCAERPLGPESWPEHRVGSWVLRRHPSLRVISLCDEGGQIGWLLGYVITPSRGLLRDADTVQVGGDAPSGVQTFLDSLGGRWVGLLVAGPTPQIQPDPTGSLAVVFDAGRRIIASTPNLIPYGPGYEDNVDLVRTMGIPWIANNTRFPFTLTPRHGVSRLLPNHVLDLDTFRPRRTWPTDDLIADPDVAGSAQRVAELLRSTIGALVRDEPCSLPLTSGKDSRMILACAREWAPQLTVYTMDLEDWASNMDARVARRVAARAGLTHQTVPHVPPTAHDLDEWLFRVSCASFARRSWRASTSYKGFDRRPVRLVGAVGELGRARFWNDDDTAATVITPERLLAWTHTGPGVHPAPVTEQTRSAVVEWLAGLPTTNAFTTLKLFYVEQQVSSWFGLLPYAEYAGPGFTIYPMNHQEIVRRLMALPEEVQRLGDFPRRVIAQEWPELLDLPFERDSGWQRLHVLPRWYGAARRRARARLARRHG